MRLLWVFAGNGLKSAGGRDFRSDLSKSAQLNSFYSIRKSNIEPWINNPDRLVKVLNDFWKSGLADSTFETELEGGNIPSVYSAIGEAETYRLLN